MTLPNLLTMLEHEEARLALARAARVEVDAAAVRHEAARRELERLEARRPNEVKLQLARAELAAARVELRRARRSLIQSI